MTTPFLPERSDHEVFEELAAGWVLHSLEPEDEGRFSAHLRTCEPCQHAVADYADALGEVAQGRTDVEPPARLGERIHAAVAKDKAPRARHRSESDARMVPPPRAALPAGAKPSRRAKGTRRAQAASMLGGRYRWLAAAALVLVVALVAGNVVLFKLQRDASQRADAQTLALQDREQSDRQLAARRAALVRLLAKPNVQTTGLRGTDGNTKAYVVVDEASVQVITDGLQPNEVPRNIYVLWRIPDDGIPRAVGAFDVTDPDIELHPSGELPADGLVVTRFGVSLEPGRRMPDKPSQILASGLVGN